MPAKKEKLVARIVIDETDELRAIKINRLGVPEKVEMCLYRMSLITIGDVIDNWDKLEKIPGCGKTKCAHIRASVFALICELGLLKKADLITI